MTGDHARPATLDEILSRFGEWIRASVRRRIDRDWEDVHQDVLLRLGRNLDSLRDRAEEPMRAFIARTIRSACIDEFRRRARDGAPLDGASAPDRRPAATADGLAGVAGLAWNRLDERQRTILALRFEKGLTFREIAVWMDETEGSVAGWYGRAMRIEGGAGMNCVDPEEASRLDQLDDPRDPARRAHLDRCASCRELDRAVVACAAGLPDHPSAAALVLFDEAPESMPAGLRREISAHVEACGECRASLAAQGRETPPATRFAIGRFRGIGPAIAALILLGIGIGAFLPEPERADPGGIHEAKSAVVVLSMSRGEEPVVIPAGTSIIDLRLVLGEEVAIGQALGFRWIDRGGKTLSESSVGIEKKDENDWPRFVLFRSVLPKGIAALEVRTPSGATLRYDWPEVR